MDKPFALFTGQHYSPHGGWNDHRGNFATVEEAAREAQRWFKPANIFDVEHEWMHIVDLRTGEIVAREG